MTKSRSTPANRRSWVPCGCLLAMFLTCVLVPTAGFMAWSFRASNQVAEQLARIHEAGLPTSTHELSEFYRIEDGGQDATQLYLEAQNEFSGSIFEADCSDLPIIGTSGLEIPPPGQPWPEQQAVEEFLAEYKDGVEALHKAAAMGGAARFPLEFDQGFAMLLPYAQQMRNCARILSLEAHVKAHQGDAKGTTEALLALATIDKSLENQPVLVSQLVCVAIQGIATSLTGWLLPYVDFSDEDLVRLREVFQQDDFKSGIAHGVVGERVIGSEAFKSPADALGPDSGIPNSSFFRGSNEDLAFYMEIQTDLREAMEADYPTALDRVDKIHDKMMVKLDTTLLGRIRYIVTGLTLPATSAAVGAAARSDARNRCIDTALAIEQFRRREGRLPETLDEMVPDFLESVPLDPFDGNPIRYVVKTDAYLLYTCGRDRVDDGGIEDDLATDEVFRIDLKPSAVASDDSSSAGRDENGVDSDDVPLGENPK